MSKSPVSKRFLLAKQNPSVNNPQEKTQLTIKRKSLKQKLLPVLPQNGISMQGLNKGPKTPSRLQLVQLTTVSNRIDQLAKPKPSKITAKHFKFDKPNSICCDDLNEWRTGKALQVIPLKCIAGSNSSNSVDKEEEPTNSDGGQSHRAFKYEISERLKELARPKVIAKPAENDSEKVPSAKLVVTETLPMDRLSRIVELTRLPKHKLMQMPAKVPGRVSYSALVCKASPRIEQLADPVVRKNHHVKNNAFGIKASALKYQPTPRINYLAQSKGRYYGQ